MKSIRYLPIYFLLLIIVMLTGCKSSSNSEASPEITSISPTEGPVGTSVTINGTGFSSTASENTVMFDSSSVPANSASEEKLNVSVPEDATTGPVSVHVDGKIATGPVFTVKAKAPGISSVEPDSGIVGAEVTVHGMNFSPVISENSISFGGTDATIKNATETELVTEVPDGATDGPIELHVNGQSTTGPDFDVITTGTMAAIIETSGPDKNVDGYSLSIDGGDEISAEITDTVYVLQLEEGSHTAKLTGMLSNCSLNGDNPRSLNISVGDTVETTFTISCKEVLNNKIVFASNRDGDFELYSMNEDGSSPQQLTQNSFYVDAYSGISFNGTQIVYARDEGNSYKIHVMNADGSNDQVLTSDSTSYLPSWSPEGSKIVFASNMGQGSDYDIFVMNSDGTNKVNITSSDSLELDPSWSPDGSKIAFISNRGDDTDNEVYVMNPDGTGVIQLTDNTAADTFLEWSPDGSKIAFTSNRGGNEDIYIMNNDGTGTQQLTNNTADDFFPSWSPDGTQIAFESDRDGNYDVYRINIDGSGLPVNLTANSAQDEVPSWSHVK